jgi:hypothetical protein
MAILRFPDATIARHPLLSCDPMRVPQRSGLEAQSIFFFCADIFPVERKMKSG